MAEVVRCSVCLEQYQKEQRDPLMLPCGHTFCRRCVVEARKSGRCVCPSCRQDLTHIEAQHLPINFQVLDLSATYTKLQHDSCSDHGDELRYWCRECERSLCSLCLYGDHPQGHQVLHANTFLQEKKQLIKDQAGDLRNFIQETKCDINSNLRMFYHKMTKLCHFETDLTVFLGDLLKARSVESVLSFEEQFKSLQDEKLGSLSDDVRKEVADGDGEHEAAIDGEESNGEHVGDAGENNIKTEGAVDQPQGSVGSDQVVDTRLARLDYHDGKLLLHALAPRVDRRLFLKLPSEVFLELGVGGRCLGRVYIHLWTNLRSGHHFLTLCLANLGPSLVGAFFKNISDKNRERETLWCTEYRLENGEKCDRALMTDLEWGGEYCRIPREGLVVLYTNSVDNYGFGICTRGKDDATFSGAFGEVSSGMDVVRLAVNHDPVCHVNITDCGVVIPDLVS